MSFPQFDTTNSPNAPLNCSCECGKSKFQLKAEPKLRFRCHCKICQKVYKKNFSDFVIVKADQVELPKLNGIQFQKHKSFFAVDRGKCPSCSYPAMAWFKNIPGLPLAMIPAANYPKEVELPAVQAHIFYDSRVEDINDDLPKVSGYLKSEWQVMKAILKTLR